MASIELVAFRCGKMKFDGKVLSADPRKGLLRALKSEDGLLHVQWVERSADNSLASQPEDDIIVFPGEATFKGAGKASQRVFMLSFPEQQDRNMFFWMQEPSADDDEVLCSKMDQTINSDLEMLGHGEDEGEEEEDEHDMAAATAMGGLIASSGLERGHTSMAQGAGTSIQAGSSIGMMPQAPGQDPQGTSMASALASMLSGMAQQSHPANSAGGPPSSSTMASALAAALASAMAGQQQQQQRVAVGPALHEVLKPEVLEPLLRDDQVLQRLAEFLPEQHRTPAAVAALPRSAQFQQQLAHFSLALQTGQLDLQQFGLRAQGFSAADFLAAIQDAADRERQSSSAQQPGVNAMQGGGDTPSGTDDAPSNAMQE